VRRHGSRSDRYPGKVIDEYQIDPDDVEEIRVAISEGLLYHGGTIYQPNDVANAQFSCRFLGHAAAQTRQ
jgi:hypothetical protein